MPDSADEEEALPVERAISAWDSMLADANDTGPAASRRPALRDIAISALRTTGLLVVVGLAILVLLPVMIAAQPTFLG